MEKKLKLWSILIVLFLFITCLPTYLEAQIPPGQDVGSRERTFEEGKEKESLIQRLIRRRKPDIEGEEEISPEEPTAMPKMPATKVLINNIVVEGVTVFTPEQIDDITSEYLGRELSLADFQEVAGKITDAYRAKGYLTTIAYLIPQKVEGNVLRIGVAEGRVGNINVSGNKHFNTKLLLKYIDLKRDELFNYDALRKNLNYINEHPDRNARVVLEKGERPRDTDVNVKVEDKLPIHAAVGYNNYNSRYVNRNKFLMELRATNFLGMDDIATAEVQLGATGQFQLYSARYLLPLDTKLKFGASYMFVDQDLGEEVEELNIKGRGHIASFYYNYKLIDNDNFTMSVSPGFDFKEIENEVLGVVLSEDNMRVAKLGFDFDISDLYGGRTLITQEFSYGIPGFMGGLEDNDSKASRAGSGGQFFKTVMNAARIQSLPFDSSLVLKGSVQYSPDNLVSTEQYTIGGFTTVRGYPVSEEVGDNGYNASTELYIPAYIVPKDWIVPFTDTTFYDALRFVAFFDWGLVTKNDTSIGEDCMSSNQMGVFSPVF